MKFRVFIVFVMKIKRYLGINNYLIKTLLIDKFNDILVNTTKVFYICFVVNSKFFFLNMDHF